MDERTILTIISEDYYCDECTKNTFIFESTDSSLTIWRIHGLMKKACMGMGYSAELVEEVFGETVYD